MAKEQKDWREQRREWRAKRREERHSHMGGIGLLVVATILIVAGLGIFFPQIPWQVFWGAVLILLGLWFVYLWFVRNSWMASHRHALSAHHTVR